MSFHYPLHRYFAAFLCQAINVQRVEIEDIIPPPGFLHTLMIHPLHLLVSASLFLSSSFTATAAASLDQKPQLVEQFNALQSRFMRKCCRCLSAIIALVLDDFWVSYMYVSFVFFLFIRQHLHHVSVYQTALGESVYDVHKILAKFDHLNLSTLFLNPRIQLLYFDILELHQNVLPTFYCGHHI